MSVKRYESVRIELEAIELTSLSYSKVNEVLEFMGKSNLKPSDVVVEGGLIIETLEGNMLASQGDFIIKGLIGEFYPCKPDVFNKKYIEI